MVQLSSDRGKLEIPPSPPAEQDPPNVRAAKLLAIVLGVLLVVAFITVFGVIGYRFAHPRLAAEPGFGTITAVIPPGAKIGQMTLDGDRIVILVTTERDQKILLFDLRKGKLLGTIVLKPQGDQGSAD